MLVVVPPITLSLIVLVSQLTQHRVKDYHLYTWYSSVVYQVGFGCGFNQSPDIGPYNAPSGSHDLPCHNHPGVFFWCAETYSGNQAVHVVGSLNLPDIILRYLLILNEGCIT